MFKARIMLEDDYEVLCQWWKAWRWTPPNRDFLPQNGTGGVIIEKDGMPVVAGFVYLTNSAVAWIEFIISNFDYKDKDRKEAITILIVELSRIAAECGAKYLYTVVKNPYLEEKYKEAGFVNGSVKVNEMVRIL